MGLSLLHEPAQGYPISIHSAQRPHLLFSLLLLSIRPLSYPSSLRLANTMHLIGSKKSASKSFDGLGLASGWSFTFLFSIA
jgi:hypothetical protein